MIRNCCYTSSFRFIYILLTHYSEGRIRKQGSRRKCCFNVYVCSDEFQENDDFFFFVIAPERREELISDYLLARLCRLYKWIYFFSLHQHQLLSKSDGFLRI